MCMGVIALYTPHPSQFWYFLFIFVYIYVRVSCDRPICICISNEPKLALIRLQIDCSEKVKTVPATAYGMNDPFSI